MHCPLWVDNSALSLPEIPVCAAVLGHWCRQKFSCDIKFANMYIVIHGYHEFYTEFSLEACDVVFMTFLMISMIS